VTNGQKTVANGDTIRFTGRFSLPEQDGPPRELNMTVRDGNGIGAFDYSKWSYSIRPIGDGLHVIIKRDPSKLKEKPEEPADALQKLEQEAAPKNKPTLNSQADTAPPKVSVMVLYTPKVLQNHGDPGMSLFIDHVLAITNKTYADSKIPLSLELVHAEEVSYVESGSVALDVERLSNPSDLSIDNIHALRNTKKADVVVMMIENADAYGMADAILADASTAFAVVDDEVADWYFTFPHEIGHLFGCRHNPEADPTASPFPYGHCMCNAEKQWRTIMSYDCTGSSTRIGLWSNPVLSHPPMNGTPAGSAMQHDNARVIRETAATIAGFR